MGTEEAGACVVETKLPEEMDSITVARQIVRRALAECGYEGHHEDVLLVVSELVTNALLHGEGGPGLRMWGGASHVRVEVSDTGAHMPEARVPGPASGWGLHVVRLLSTGWGISSNGEGKEGGKMVWCELASV
ncbi:ATP-binding protein [Nonomuraea jiangxiensis]|uniref:Histidine kinase/HSP90-like ATPase domain-containing protein n=1 Tax=Nonomuraea jiangxiensis TaxID=633440 RepID=A0A1G8KE57_9ACTN|nr:ATP-binding protein [Nonomuraea jiangxiensis]SDI41702.1 hypothetical protein SAMN05421869_105371 [Nonomuraea jiangxiensis]